MNAPCKINAEERRAASIRLADAGQSCRVVTSQIVAQQGPEQWHLEDGQIAHRAFSCLVHPEVGDEVLTAISDKAVLIISILARPHAGQSVAGCVGLPAEVAMTIRGANLKLFASSSLVIECLKDIDLKTPFGKVQVLAESFIQTVFGTFVSLARSHLVKTTNYELKAEGSIVSTGEIQVLTAKSDIVMDASRINMG